MPVATLLELKAWEPHQKLLAAGSVRECTADDDVIFVSHQWLGFEHPDPKHDQLRALQRMIRRLLSGELTVESNATLQVLYGLQQTTTADEWARRLPKMLVWFDYTSVPQPSAADAGDAAQQVLARQLGPPLDEPAARGGGRLDPIIYRALLHDVGADAAMQTP